MQTVWDILYLRRPVLNYLSPPICEVIFSGSSNPVIILSEPLIGRVTGVAIGGFGAFQLTWNAFPGALCYNVYFIGGDNLAVILAQCIPCCGPYELPQDLGPGFVVITPVTLEGEGPPSDPVPLPTPGGGGVQSVFVRATCPSASRATFPGEFTFYRDFTLGNLTIFYTISGTAVNGTDYQTITSSITFPHGVSEVTRDITPIEAVLLSDKTVIVTINESPFYFIAPGSTATVNIRKPYLRVKDYGTGTAPLFVPAPAGGEIRTAGPSQGCEWDGTLNLVENYPPIPGPEFVYYYQDTDGNYLEGVNESVQGTALYRVFLAGPFTGGVNKWQMQILGTTDDGSLYIIWQGHKTHVTGGNADGVYEISGAGFSDLRPTVEFEFFP